MIRVMKQEINPKDTNRAQTYKLGRQEMYK